MCCVTSWNVTYSKYIKTSALASTEFIVQRFDARHPTKKKIVKYRIKRSENSVLPSARLITHGCCSRPAEEKDSPKRPASSLALDTTGVLPSSPQYWVKPKIAHGTPSPMRMSKTLLPTAEKGVRAQRTRLSVRLGRFSV